MPDDVWMERRDDRGDEADAGRAEPRADREDDERGRDGDDDLCDADREPRASEREVDPREEPAVQRLRVRRRDAGKEPERAVVDERRREAVALVDELLEDGPALVGEDEEPRHRRREDDDEGAASTVSSMASSTMGATSRERYAVVSCHVERPLDDARLGAFLRAAARGVPVASRSRR